MKAKLGIIVNGKHYYLMEKVDWWCAPTLATDVRCKHYTYNYPIDIDSDDEQVGPQELVGWLT